MKYLPDIYKHLQRMLESRTHSAIACVVSRTGSGPREAGAMMLVSEDGFSAGTVGGGLLEARVINVAQTVIQSGKPVCEIFNLDADAAADDGMICGGTMEVFVEPITTKPVLYMTKISKTFFVRLRKFLKVSAISDGASLNRESERPVEFTNAPELENACLIRRYTDFC